MTLAAAITRQGRVVHLGLQEPPYRSLCGQRLWDFWPPWYVLHHPPELPACRRCEVLQ